MLTEWTPCVEGTTTAFFEQSTLRRQQVDRVMLENRQKGRRVYNSGGERPFVMRSLKRKTVEYAIEYCRRGEMCSSHLWFVIRRVGGLTNEIISTSLIYHSDEYKFNFEMKQSLLYQRKMNGYVHVTLKVHRDNVLSETVNQVIYWNVCSTCGYKISCFHLSFTQTEQMRDGYNICDCNLISTIYWRQSMLSNQSALSTRT